MFNSIFPQKNWQYFLMIALFTVLFLLSAFRDGVGTDYLHYQYLFNSYLTGTDGEWQSVEPGFQLIFKVTSIFSNDSRLFFVLTSFLILCCFFIAFLKYSRSVLLSVFLFITLYYYFNSLNGVRQFLAMALVLCFSTRSLAERNFLKYLISIIFASLFHMSALFMLPAYFLCKELKAIEIFYLIFFILVVFLLYDFVFAFVFKIFPYYQIYSEYKSGSASAFLLIQLLFFLLVFLAYKKSDSWTKEELVSFNLSLFSLFFFVLSYKNTMFFRLGMFFGMYFLILVPATLNSFISSKNKFIFYCICFILGLINLSYHLYHNVSEVLPFTMDFNL